MTDRASGLLSIFRFKGHLPCVGSKAVFHSVTGANGRLKTGQILDLRAEGLDVYNTLLSQFDVQQRLGPADRNSTIIDQIIV
ncbi:MAG TPA: hypothetical protein DIT88_09180 [Planctomycetaceae bacterium]|nr:hypothetical protein [Planctomycetaceae bacterium]